jgi:hypothetical protein
MRFRPAAVLGLFALSLAWASPARAQQGAIADELYKQGQKLLDQGKVHEACEKFQASQEADPAIGTLINLASCHEKEGRTASAWDEFTEAASQASKANQRDREKYSREHADALEKQLHRLVIEILSPPENVVVKLDQKTLTKGVLGTALPLDPGEHDLEVSAPGKKAWQQHLKLGPGAVTERVEVPKLEDEAGAPPPSGPVPGNQGQSDKPAQAPSSSSGNIQRIVGFSIGGVGLVAGIIAVAYEITALGRDRDSHDITKTNNDQGTVNAIHDQAKQAELYAIVFAGVSVAALATGIVLVVTAPSGTPKSTAGVRLSPTFGRTGGGAALTATF